jgi:hypothetical protein
VRLSNKLKNNNSGSKSKKRTTKKGRADIMEKRLAIVFSLCLCAILLYVGLHIATKGINLTQTGSNHYATLTQTETGTKEVYGAKKDASGNISNLNDLVAISCYGDSFTNAADDATASYAGVLSMLAQRTVYNVAADNDSIFEMAAREGGRPIVVSPFIIPTNKASTEVLISNIDGKELNFDFSKNGGLNPCSINGIEGLLSVINGKFCFTRAESGDESLVLTPTKVETRAMSLRNEDICIFFLGDDDIYKTPEEAVKIYKDMINALKSENKTYLIVGPIKGETAVLDEANKVLADAFGNNFIDMRNYLMNDAANDLNITLSEDDTILATGGIVPYVYFNDSKHLSAQGADAVAYGIYNKLKTLNYLADEK